MPQALLLPAGLAAALCPVCPDSSKLLQLLQLLLLRVDPRHWNLRSPGELILALLLQLRSIGVPWSLLHGFGVILVLQALLQRLLLELLREDAAAAQRRA